MHLNGDRLISVKTDFGIQYALGGTAVFVSTIGDYCVEKRLQRTGVIPPGYGEPFCLVYAHERPVK